MSDENKRGPWSKEEKEFIHEYAGKILPEDIAFKLKRNAVAIKKYMEENGYMKYYTNFSTNDHTKTIMEEFKNTPAWKEIVSQFDAKEIELFLYHWEKIMNQFKDDVLDTEAMQIVDMVKLEVLMNRLLTKQESTKRGIESLQSEIHDEQLKDKDDRDVDLIRSNQATIASLLASVQALSREYLDLQKQKQDLQKQLKGTREQRIKDIETSKESIASLYRKILNDKDFRKSAGIYMEKMRLATEVEIMRLSDFHTYADGEVDQPYLTPDTVK